MNKKKEMNFNVNNFLLSITNILDVRDIEENNVSKLHSLRIAYVALKIGERINLEPKEMFNLCAYGLFHNYIDGKNAKLLGIIDDLQVLKNIISFVHDLDFKYDLSIENISNRTKIIDSLLHDNHNEKYKNILLEMCEVTDFWMDCQSPNMMLQYVYNTLYDFTEVLTFEQVLDKTIMIGSLSGNTDTLLDSCEKMTEFYNFEEKDKWTFLIAASMLNFGKLSIPVKILSKKEQLTNEEYETLKSYIYLNKNALRSIYGFDDISKWATRHQEQLDGNGYPSKMKASDLSLKDRLIAILNIYNSLTNKNDYRDALTYDETIKILRLKAKDYHLDKAIVEDIVKVFG